MSNKPIATWLPDATLIKQTHLYEWMQQENTRDYQAFHAWSCQNHSQFLEKLVKKLPIVFDKPFSEAMNLEEGVEAPCWFKEGCLNIATSCFTADPHAIAIIEQTEKGECRSITYAELNELSNRIASAITARYQRKDRFAIIMPMHIEAVALHLGIIKAGCTTIAIAESFSKTEIEARLRIAQATALFVQDHLYRQGKEIPLYASLAAEIALPMILLDKGSAIYMLRSQDMTFASFLALGSAEYQAVSCLPSDYTTILFSSGTTADPKAIPWTHVTPIKCASDAYFHHDLKSGDRFLWPTSLGWMMGAWLIYATLINKATIALFDGAPNHPRLGQFIAEQKITHVGVVPTIVKNWRASACMEGNDWSSIKLFTSTGECSNADDMQYLMGLGQHKPVIEYCGGTEIGGAYITSTLIVPNAPAAFTTPAIGIDFLILNEAGDLSTCGAVALKAPALGLSAELLNGDHHAVYYAGMQQGDNEHSVLRRHGDVIEQFDNGFYQLLGRADDTMNLSGIKVSCVEIERLLTAIPYVKEVAAVGITPSGGGPSVLVVFAVLKENEMDIDAGTLKTMMQKVIKQELNPLFHLFDVVCLEALPRTASNKIVRRFLKADYEQHLTRV